MFKTLQAFDALQVLIASMAASCGVLVWSGLLLFLFMMLGGIFVISLITSYMSDTSNDITGRLKVWEDWGTFTRAMISMFDITFTSHTPATWRLVQYVSEWWALYLLLYKFVVGFAMVRVITGVFLHETFKVAEGNDELMTLQKRRKKERHAAKMRRLLLEADKNQDGQLDLDELKNLFENEEMRLWLAAQELEPNDCETLFYLLDNSNEGVVTYGDLVQGVGHLKGAARSIDVINFQHQFEVIAKQLLEIHSATFPDNYFHRPLCKENSNSNTKPQDKIDA